MCGRFAFYSPSEAALALFGVHTEQALEMPVILRTEGADRWLSGDNELIHQVADNTPELQAWPVDRRVNNARNEGSELIETTR